MPWKAKQEVLVSFFFSVTRVCTMETATPRRNPGYATAFGQVLQKTMQLSDRLVGCQQRQQKLECKVPATSEQPRPPSASVHKLN